MAAIYLGLPLPTGSSDLPAVNTRARHQRLGLAGGGVCPAGIVTDAAVRSYRTISPLPRTSRCVAVYFLWHFPVPHLFASSVKSEITFGDIHPDLRTCCCDDETNRCGRWSLATTVPCPARTFLPAPNGARRPPDPLLSIFIINF